MLDFIASDTFTYIFGLVALLYVLIRLYLRKRTMESLEDAPIISSQTLFGGGRLTPMHQGETAGYKHHILANSKGTIMALVELGRNTNLHLIAMGDKSGLESSFRTALSKGYLERVVLEGDFPSYFKVYATPERHVEVRQVMEPRNMAQFVDYCRTNNIEIFHDTMFICEAEGADESVDSTTMMHDLGAFLEKNKSLLNRL